MKAILSGHSAANREELLRNRVTTDWDVSYVIVTPHSSAWTEQLIERRYGVIAGNLDRLARGEILLNVVEQAPLGVATG